MQQDIEHPENDACYEGLAVNKGIEQPDPVNPAIAERLKHLKKKVLSADEYITGILNGNINILSQAITLVESARIDHQAMDKKSSTVASPTRENPYASASREFPAPGKVPLSKRSVNSSRTRDIKLRCWLSTRVANALKWKHSRRQTRMEELACDPHAYIRPSPSAGSLGRRCP